MGSNWIDFKFWMDWFDSEISRIICSIRFDSIHILFKIELIRTMNTPNAYAQTPTTPSTGEVDWDYQSGKKYGLSFVFLLYFSYIIFEFFRF